MQANNFVFEKEISTINIAIVLGQMQVSSSAVLVCYIKAGLQVLTSLGTQVLGLCRTLVVDRVIINMHCTGTKQPFRPYKSVLPGNKQ